MAFICQPLYAQIITRNIKEITMGIHYDYKNTRGDKKLRKQQEREERRLAKKKEVDINQPEVAEGTALTLDMITEPNK